MQQTLNDLRALFRLIGAAVLASVSVGTHFGCFQLADEGLDDSLIELARARHGVSLDAFQVLETGETRRFARSVAPAYAERVSA